MRQLCNVAYTVMVEGMSRDDKLEFDDKLNAAPWETPQPRSKGVGALMSLFGPQGLAPRS